MNSAGSREPQTVTYKREKFVQQFALENSVQFRYIMSVGHLGGWSVGYHTPKRPKSIVRP